MFRPSPQALAGMFQGHEILEAKELSGDTYWVQVRKRPAVIFARHFFRFFVPFLGWHAWKRSMRKLYWLFNPYKVSVVVGRKVSQAASMPATAQADGAIPARGGFTPV